ncbi:MAG: hypothetical protein M5R36_12475 [Deltaproteobacteria bacterium]|nr:hypothetical protein [Deltaproteobacteria bacterium]
MPYALEKPGYMNLRVVETSVPKIVANLGKVWKGEFEDPKLFDYLVTKVRLESDGPMPLQLGGDPEGYRDSILVGVSSQTVDVLDYRKELQASPNA